jgi:cell wall-associated NlpC family hydrolase
MKIKGIKTRIIVLVALAILTATIAIAAPIKPHLKPQIKTAPLKKTSQTKKSPQCKPAHPIVKPTTKSKYKPPQARPLHSIVKAKPEPKHKSLQPKPLHSIVKTKPRPKHKSLQPKSKLKNKHKTKPTKPHYVPPPPNKAAKIVVETAFEQLGKPYQYASSGPYSFDCSGLISYCYKKAGVILPHNAAKQQKVSTPVAYKDLQPGDLLFFHNAKHVGMYIGHDEYIQAPHTGKAVYISKLAPKQNFFSARRPHVPKFAAAPSHITRHKKRNLTV